VVLVVDDESAIADTVAEILSRSGYAAMTAYDGNEALETALVTPPEMLITDVILPGMSGIELSIKMRRIFPDCKILLFSGQAATVDLLATARGASSFQPAAQADSSQRSADEGRRRPETDRRSGELNARQLRDFQAPGRAYGP